MDLSKLDMKKLAADLVPILTRGLEHVLEGTKDDIQTYSQAIALDMLEAQLTGDAATEEQLMDQLKLLAEVQSIRVRNESWWIVTNVVETIFKAAAAGIVAVF